MRYALGVAALVAGLALVASANAQTGSNRVRVEGGVVEGQVLDGVTSFKGIPYATPPVGKLRWRPPQPAKRWSGVLQARNYAPDCMQRRLATAYAPITTEPSEDCLYVNVWRPAEASSAKLPVMVYIYGGGFTRGGSSSVLYQGDAFAKQGVVMVSFNYRVGRFGFFAHPALTAEHPQETKGNYAFMDQIAALKWIQRNIEAFGGDPNKVTIVGESAGGNSVHAMMVSPMVRGTFHGAIMMSSGPNGRNPANTPRRLSEDVGNMISLEKIGVNFASSKGISGTDAASLARLRALPADEVVDLPAGGPEGGSPQSVTWGGGFAIDGKVIVESAADAYRAGRQAQVPILIGSNTDDRPGVPNNTPVNLTAQQVVARFGARSADALRAYDPEGHGDVTEMSRKISMDAQMTEPHRFAAATVASQGIPSYLYRWGYNTQVLKDRWWRGTPHAAELAYVFEVISPYYGPARSDEDFAVAKAANTYWANFVKTGNPNGPGMPEWPRYDPAKDEIMIFRLDGKTAAAPDPWKARLDLTAALADAAR